MERLFKMRGILDQINSQDPLAVIPDDDEMAGYLMSKLDPGTHTNIITPENEDSTKLIWLAAKNHFASSQAANWARMFFDFLYLGFNQNDIENFVTSVKAHLVKLDEVGITLPNDILSYLILFKLPDSLKTMRSQIMHSGCELSVILVLNHLVQHKNEVRSKTSDTSNTNTAMFYSNTSRESDIPRCENGQHNPAVKSHPPSSCWVEFPELRPEQSSNKGRRGFKKKQPAELHYYDYSFFCASNHLTEVHADRCILDSGCSIHMFHDQNLFVKLKEESGKEFFKTGKKGEGIVIRGLGTAVLKSTGKIIHLENAAWVPDATVNLVSLGALLLKGCSLRVNSKSIPPTFELVKTRDPILSGNIEKNLLMIQSEKFKGTSAPMNPINKSEESISCNLTVADLNKLHLKLGHAGVD